MPINSRRAMIALAVGAVAAAIGIAGALDDGSGKADRFDAADLSLPRLAGQRLVAGFAGARPPSCGR